VYIDGGQQDERNRARGLHVSDFRTLGGEILPEVTLAYVTRGKLAADGRNAILITHGYTSGPRMIEPGVAFVGRGVEHAGRPRGADRYGSIFCGLFQYAWIQLRVDQRGVDRSADPQALRVQISAHHRGRYRHRANAHADRVGRDASASSRRPVLRWVSGVPMGRDVPQLHGRHRSRGNVASTAKLGSGRRFVEMVRARSELAWRRLLRDGRCEADINRAGAPIL